jgi:hypothetical protein
VSSNALLVRQFTSIEGTTRTHHAELQAGVHERPIERPKLDNKPRARRDAAKVLGVALQTRYRKLLEANGR